MQIIATGQGDGYRTGCLVFYSKFKVWADCSRLEQTKSTHCWSKSDIAN